MRDRFLLREDVCFLNHGSFGACPRPVFEEYQRLQRELESQPLEFLDRQINDRLAVARAALGDFVGADAGDLVFVPNATTGLNIVIRSLPLQPGDEVLSTNHEYGALDRAWTFVCERRGCRYVRRPMPTRVRSAAEVVEAIWSGVTGRTRVLFLSHITAPTAIVLPVAELVGRAREAGLITVIDGAHAPGQLDLDLDGLGADFYAGNCHKWLMSPKGSALLHARREAQEMVSPLIVSWGWRSDDPGPSRFVDEHQWQGTWDPSACLSVPAAIDFQRQLDWPAERGRCHDLLRLARRRLGEAVGLEAVTPDSPEWQCQMLAFALPRCDGVALQRRLLEDFNIEVPVKNLGGPDTPLFLRISAQIYNTEDDIERLVGALEVLAPEFFG